MGEKKRDRVEEKATKRKKRITVGLKGNKHAHL
jgi:hypothetical protein